MLNIFTKQIKFNFYSGAVKSGIIWFVSLVIFIVVSLYFNTKEYGLFMFGFLLACVFIGGVSYLVLIYSLSNILDTKIRRVKSKFVKSIRFLIITVFVGFLIFGVPIGVIGGMAKINSLTTNVNSSSVPTSTTNQSLDENKLWNLVNDWEKKQGYRSYIKDNNLCQAAETLLTNSSLWWDKEWYKKVNLDSSYYSNGFNSATGNNNETLFNFWTTDKEQLKNLKDTYFQYSCIKCQQSTCFQVFANKNNINYVNNPINTGTSNLINNNSVVNCNVGKHCGVVQIQASACSNAGCCQIGINWYIYFSHDKCKEDQVRYYQLQKQNINNEEYLRQVRESVQQRINYYNQIFNPKEEFGSIVNDFNNSANQILNEAQNYPTKIFEIPQQDLSEFDSFKNIPTPTSSKIKCSSLQGIAHIEQMEKLRNIGNTSESEYINIYELRKIK